MSVCDQSFREGWRRRESMKRRRKGAPLSSDFIISPAATPVPHLPQSRRGVAPSPEARYPISTRPRRSSPHTALRHSVINSDYPLARPLACRPCAPRRARVSAVGGDWLLTRTVLRSEGPGVVRCSGLVSRALPRARRGPHFFKLPTVGARAAYGRRSGAPQRARGTGSSSCGQGVRGAVRVL